MATEKNHIGFKLMMPSSINIDTPRKKAFFLGVSIFMLLGIISLNPIWFFSVAIMMGCAFLFNLVAVYSYGTEHNSALVFEIVVTLWYSILGWWIKRT